MIDFKGSWQLMCSFIKLNIIDSMLQLVCGSTSKLIFLLTSDQQCRNQNVTTLRWHKHEALSIIRENIMIWRRCYLCIPTTITRVDMVLEAPESRILPSRISLSWWSLERAYHKTRTKLPVPFDFSPTRELKIQV